MSHNESVYQHALKQILKGDHMKLWCGITDISTEQFHAELKHWSQWKSAFGQIIWYNLAMPREEARVYLIGSKPKAFNEDFISNMMAGFQKHSIRLFSALIQPVKSKMKHLFF